MGAYRFICFLAVSIMSCVFGFSTHRMFCRRESALTASLGDFKEQLAFPPDNICNAVDKTKNRKLTVADASTLAGCDLRTARNGLVLLASLTGANLDVTKDGEIVYKFKGIFMIILNRLNLLNSECIDDFRQILLRRSLGQRLKTLYNTVKGPFSFLFRISFGLLLFASLFVIGTTFAFISVQGESSSENRDDNRRSSTQMTSFDFFSFGPSPYDYIVYGRPSASASPGGDGEISLLESFYSYIFGDGDPNEGTYF